jgi:transposase
VVSLTLLAELPELGRLSHKEIAALVGGAPLNRDSGTLRGKRLVYGDRAPVRAALYMAALVASKCNPVIRAFYSASAPPESRPRSPSPPACGNCSSFSTRSPAAGRHGGPSAAS